MPNALAMLHNQAGLQHEADAMPGFGPSLGPSAPPSVGGGLDQRGAARPGGGGKIRARTVGSPPPLSRKIFLQFTDAARLIWSEIRIALIQSVGNHRAGIFWVVYWIDTSLWVFAWILAVLAVAGIWVTALVVSGLMLVGILCASVVFGCLAFAVLAIGRLRRAGEALYRFDLRMLGGSDVN